MDGTKYYNANFVFDKQKEMEYILFDEGRIVNYGGNLEYEYHVKDHLGSVRVAFVPTTSGTEIVQENAYYPFGGTIGDFSYNASENRYKHTGMEAINDFGLNMLDNNARWRDVSAVPRFYAIDPLAEASYQASPYAYCENNPMKYVDISGLIKYLAITMGGDVNYRGQIMSKFNSNIEHHRLNNGITGLVSTLKTATNQDPEGIGFVSIWSHGIPGEIFESGNWSTKSITNNDLSILETAIDNGEVKFADGAIIYLGACNAGTDSDGVSFAQKLADITGMLVIAAKNDKVGPKEETITTLKYTTYYPQRNQFNSFLKDKNPFPIGSEVDVMSLFRRSEQRTHPTQPLPRFDFATLLNSWLQQNPNIKIEIKH